MWKPISTAPKDGTYVLIYLPKVPDSEAGLDCDIVAGCYVGRPDDNNGWWISDKVEVSSGYYDGWDVECLRLSPSHWMPLPDGPA